MNTIAQRDTHTTHSISDAVAAHPKADVFINFASFRSAFDSSLEALKQDSIRVVAIIAEGVPEADAKQLITYANANNKVIIGPATVGGIQAGAFKIGDTAGTIDNIVTCKLHRPGSVGFVSKSGGMSNELYNVLARTTDGLYEGACMLLRIRAFKRALGCVCRNPSSTNHRHCHWRRCIPRLHAV